MPVKGTIVVIIFTALVFTIFLLIGVVILGNGFFFSKIKKSSYERKDMFSWNEKRFYRTLEKILKEKYGEKYVIFPQVRLADLFNVVIEDDDDSMYNLKIQGHVDFLIADREKLEPVLGIELNGKSHHGYAQKAADEFKKKLYNESGDEKNKLKMVVFWNDEMKYNDKDWEFFKKKLAARINNALNE